jgi:hypothetical protein
VGPFQIFLGSLVAAGWFGSLCDAIVVSDYRALDLTTPLMLMVVGYAFGESVIRRRYPREGRA